MQSFLKIWVPISGGMVAGYLLGLQGASVGRLVAGMGVAAVAILIGMSVTTVIKM